MLINVIGNGTVGNTLVKWLRDYNKDVAVNIYDPGHGRFDSMEYGQATFISVPVPIKGLKQDLSIIEESIERTNRHSLIFIRSTVLPGTCEMLSKKYNRLVCSMPEFLTERRAYEDFCNTNKIIIGIPYPREERVFPSVDSSLLFNMEDIDYKIRKILNELFKEEKEVEILFSEETEMTKYIHNCFGAVKVTYFNAMKHLCDKNGISFKKAMRNVFNTGFINKEHTLVPGPDGKMGYGGSCFPENIDSMIGFCGSDITGQLFKDIHLMNKYFRHGSENYKK